MTPRSTRNVVAKLVLLLVALNGKGGDGGSKLIVAKGLEAGSCEEAHSEREIEHLPNLRIGHLGVVEGGGFQCWGGEAGRRKLHLVVHQNVVVIRGCRRAGRLQRPLLKQIIPRVVAVERATHKPL